MTITMRLSKVEYEMLKELQKKDKRYKRGLEIKARNVITNRRNLQRVLESNIKFDIS